MNRDDAAGGLRGLRAPLSSALIQAVRDAYGFSGAEDIVDLGGASSLNLRVGEGGRRYVVRAYRPYVTSARLDDIQQVRRQLGAAGVPCSDVLLTRDARPWIVFDDRLVEVEHHVDHDVCMDSWERLESALPMLGHIHTILRGTTTGRAGRRPVFANHLESQIALDRTRRGTQRIRGWASSPSELHLADTADELAHLVTTLEHDLLSGLPRQLVHGDFWHDNVLFRSGDVVLVADLGFMGERARIDDLALTLYFTSLKYAEDSVSDDHLRRLRRLVDAYDSGLADRLSRAERAALPLALARQPLWSIGGWVALLDDEAAARQHAAGTSWALDWALSIVREINRWQTAFA